MYGTIIYFHIGLHYKYNFNTPVSDKYDQASLWAWQLWVSSNV